MAFTLSGLHARGQQRKLKTAERRARQPVGRLQDESKDFKLERFKRRESDESIGANRRPTPKTQRGQQLVP